MTARSGEWADGSPLTGYNVSHEGGHDALPECYSISGNTSPAQAVRPDGYLDHTYPDDIHAHGTSRRGVPSAPRADPRRGRRRRDRGWFAHARRAGRPAGRTAGDRRAVAGRLPRPALAVHRHPVLALVRRAGRGRADRQVGAGRGAAPAGLAGRAPATATEPLVRVLRGADRAGLAAADARGHARVRRRRAAVLLALPGRVSDHALDRRRAQSRRDGPGLVAPAAAAAGGDLAARQLRRADGGGGGGSRPA